MFGFVSDGMNRFKMKFITYNKLYKAVLEETEELSKFRWWLRKLQFWKYKEIEKSILVERKYIQLHKQMN